MGMTANELAERMTAKEFYERYALECLDPSIEVRGDIHAAQICQMLHACNSTKKVGKLKEYMVDFWKKAKSEMTVEEMSDFMLAFTISRGGNVSKEALEDQQKRLAENK